jgi:hypothetical protein
MVIRAERTSEGSKDKSRSSDEDDSSDGGSLGGAFVSKQVKAAIIDIDHIPSHVVVTAILASVNL